MGLLLKEASFIRKESPSQKPLSLSGQNPLSNQKKTSTMFWLRPILTYPLYMGSCNPNRWEQLLRRQQLPDPYFQPWLLPPPVTSPQLPVGQHCFIVLFPPTQSVREQISYVLILAPLPALSDLASGSFMHSSQRLWISDSFWWPLCLDFLIQFGPREPSVLGLSTVTHAGSSFPLFLPLLQSCRSSCTWTTSFHLEWAPCIQGHALCPQVHPLKARSPRLSLVQDKAPVCPPEKKPNLLVQVLRFFYNITFWERFPIVLCSGQTGQFIIP